MSGAADRMMRLDARWTAAAALALTIVVALARWTFGIEHGLVRTIHLAADAPQETIPVRVTTFIGNDSFDKERRDAGLTPGERYEWDGIWDVSAAGVYGIAVGGSSEATVALDGATLIDQPFAHKRDTAVVKAPLARGPHRISIVYIDRGDHDFDLTWDAGGSGPRPFGQLDLYPSLRVWRAWRWLAPIEWLAVAGWILAGALLLGRTFAHAIPRSRADRAAAAALAVVLLYGALLRFDALISRWGPVPGSPSAVAAQERVAAVARAGSPAAMSWPRSPNEGGGDPYAYLQEARERSNFYGAHLREPVFPFAVKAVLAALGQPDIAVCVASAIFSWLTILAVYWLGCAAFSRWIGLGAALALAVERNVIGFGVSGFRDDAFTALAIAAVAATIWTAERPTIRRSVVWGVLAAAVCLTRITAISFLVPLLGYRLWRQPRESRWRSAAASLATLLVLVSPYLIACWIRFGTPVYAVTGVASSWNWADHAGQPTDWSGTLSGRILDHPFDFLDSLCFGALRAFSDRWEGFAVWASPLEGTLAAAAILGLLGFMWSPAGRFLLLFLATSPVPYLLIVTTLPADARYRYTLHAYPIFLLASCYAIARTASAFSALRDPASRSWAAVAPVARRAAVTVLVAAAACAVALALPPLRMLEELRRSSRTVVAAGPRDQFLFRNGWYAPVTMGGVTARYSANRHATVWVPMLEGRPTSLTLRLDPLEAEGTPPQVVQVRLNGTLLATLTLRLNPKRFGSYRISVPVEAIRGGFNRLDLLATYATAPRDTEPAPAGAHRLVETALAGDRPGSMRLWYVMVSQRPRAG